MIFWLLGLGLSGAAQTRQLTGNVSDQHGMPLNYVNVVAHLVNDTINRIISITNQAGHYKLSLEKDSLYYLNIRYLGYMVRYDTVILSRDKKKDYHLRQYAEQLKTVVIKNKIPVMVLDDKTVYDADAFRNNTERKLYDLLKKMPGIRVDRQGNVRYNGKSIKNLTIGGRRFFTGDPNLGVLNIPADAIEKVEVLKNHHQIGMLNDVDEEGSRSLNIKLKKDHQKFMFGESKISGGNKERYLVNPNIFYYSPKTSLNFIGDFDNFNESQFSPGGFQNFNNDFDKLTHNSTDFKSGDEGSAFLASVQSTAVKTIFGAINLNQKLSDHWQMNINSFTKQGETRTHNRLTTDYFSEDKNSETRNSKNHHRLFYTMNKARFKYDNLDDIEFLGNLIYKYSDGSGLDRVSSHSGGENHFIQTKRMPENTNLIGMLSFNKRFDYEHLLAVNGVFNYRNKADPHYWQFDQPVFNQLIPFEPQSDTYNFSDFQSTQNRTARINAKLYWILNRTSHIYPEAGINYLSTSFITSAVQKTEDGGINSFDQNGFGNDLVFRLQDAFGGLTYKMMIGKLLMHAGAFVHLYQWQINQKEETDHHREKSVLLPFFRAKYKMNNSEEIKFKYALKSNFADAENFANRYRLIDFNQIYRGNETLKNELFHRFNLHYERSDFYSRWIYNADLSYEHVSKYIQNETELQGVNYVNVSIMSHLPKNTYSAHVDISKSLDIFEISWQGSVFFSDYFQQINQQVLSYQSNTYRYSFGLRYDKTGKLGFELNFTQSFNLFSTDHQKDTRFMQLQPDLHVDYRFFYDWLFKANYHFSFYKNQSRHTSNTFDIGYVSLLYKQKDKSWGIELELNNIFDMRFQQNNMTSAFMVTDQRTFIQPRTILLSLTYQL